MVYLLYHYPLAEVRRTIREGGPWQQWLDRRGRSEMRSAAARLPAVPDFADPPLELHQLTGREFAFQSTFCLWTLAHAAQRLVAPIFYDDGTLRPEQRKDLLSIFPLGRVIAHEETWSRLERHLPEKRFLVLRERFEKYPQIRKLINPHLGSSGWKLVLDSDLLFYRRPGFILDWLGDPQRPLHMIDVADAYGYSPRLLEKFAGGPIPHRVNVGLCGLLSESLDWEKLEWWCARLLQAEGSHYLLEQALTALLLTGQSCAIAPAHEYVTLPDKDEIFFPTAAMHHYVAGSKRWYFREAWRRSYSRRNCE
jgi:hypothetical protein